MTYSRPLLIIGNGARGLDWTKFGIPIVTTRLGIDLIESDHRLFAGRYGLFTDTPSYLAVKNADYVICVGARLDPGFAGYNLADFAPQASIMVVDIDKQELLKVYDNVKWTIHKTAKDFYNDMLTTGPIGSVHPNWLDQIHAWQKKYPLKLTGSYKVIREISDQATKDDVIVVDTSSAFHIVAQTWQIKKGQKYITTGGISTMGYWPAAIGAALASGRRVICITGDGCLQMNIQELATVVKNKLNIKIIVLNNDGYLLIRHTQKKYFGRLGGESPKTGLGFPNLKDIAKAYGIKYIGTKYNWNYQFPDALELTMRLKEPVLCEIKIPHWEHLQGRLDELSQSPILTNQTY